MPSTTSRKVKLSELSFLGLMKAKLGKLGIVSRDMFEKNVTFSIIYFLLIRCNKNVTS